MEAHMKLDVKRVVESWFQSATELLLCVYDALLKEYFLKNIYNRVNIGFFTPVRLKCSNS